jgi:transglutaminase-like putative cysteine protease
MKNIDVCCELQYDVKTPTTMLFNLSVATTEYQSIVSESLWLTPYMIAEQLQVGAAHNRVQRVYVEPGLFSIQYSANVNLGAEVHCPETLSEKPYACIPADVLPYLNPSRYCQSDLLANFAMSEFGAEPHGYRRVQAICDWTYQHLAYVSGSTDSETTARDVLVQRQGVCRDFAHLAISLCRGLGIPARYVSGYAVDLEPPDFHGFFEAYLGERWYLFDATRLAPVEGLIRIATGVDASEVPFATLIGTTELKSKVVWARLSSANQVLQVPGKDSAVSTA